MKLLLATALVLAGCTSVRAQVPAPPAEQVITIAMPASEWNTVLQGLGELPLKVSFALVQNIQKQAQDQMKPKKDGK